MILNKGVPNMRMVMLFGLCVLFFAFVEPTTANESNGAGIVFFNTPQLEEIKDFYIDRIGCRLWIDQGSCAILKYGNLLIGFCSGEKRDPEGVITFFYKNREDVDLQYEKFKTIAIDTPKENKKYQIYHFYARDPDGRSIEFQHFMHPIVWEFDKFK